MGGLFFVDFVGGYNLSVRAPPDFTDQNQLTLCGPHNWIEYLGKISLSNCASSLESLIFVLVLFLGFRCYPLSWTNIPNKSIKNSTHLFYKEAISWIFQKIGNPRKNGSHQFDWFNCVFLDKWLFLLYCWKSASLKQHPNHF